MILSSVRPDTPPAARQVGRSPADFLLDPWVAASAVILLLNDHVLKALFGNTFTGKLSDVAGVFLLPLLMLALAEALCRGLLPFRRPVERRWLSTRRDILGVIALVGLGFTAVKVLTPVGDLYEYMVGVLRKLATFSPDPVTPIVVYRDRTDLLVLPVLLGTYLVARKYR